jgi:secondary thiamine-phosphate synthase enzyme
MSHREEFRVETRGRGTTDITSEVQRAVADSGVETGVATVFLHHTSASLFINENADPTVRRDLEAFMSRLVPDGDGIYQHTAEGPDDMSAHVRTLLTRTSISIPVFRGRCDLGTWQGLFLWEHRTSSHTRRVSVTVVG